MQSGMCDGEELRDRKELLRVDQVSEGREGLDSQKKVPRKYTKDWKEPRRMGWEGATRKCTEREGALELDAKAPLKLARWEGAVELDRRSR